MVSFGTRPEYIKVLPIIKAIPDCIVLFTGQHSTLLEGIRADRIITIPLEVRRHDYYDKGGERLNQIFSSVLSSKDIFKGVTHCMVQGDTASSFAVALYAFHSQITVIHLEAGLRTYDQSNPYPEETYRQLISRIATIHLCPTELNKQNLINERVTGDIYVIGNTGLDSLGVSECKSENKVLITLHRRENIKNMGTYFSQINAIAKEFPQYNYILPMHPNPDIQAYRKILSEKINVVKPLPHDELINIIKGSEIIITDSGGIQEEASYFRKKTIVCRIVTERPEIVGISSTLCTDPTKLLETFKNILGLAIPIDFVTPYFNRNGTANDFKRIWEKI